MFKTKEVKDFVRPGRKYEMLLKTGYDSKSDQTRYIAGGGFRTMTFEGLMQYTKREGHETENYEKYPDKLGPKRKAPDPLDSQTESILFKMGYNFYGDHWIRGAFEDREQTKDVDEKSFNGWERRFVEECSPYRRYGLTYEWMPEPTFVENVTFTYANQNIEGQSISTLKDFTKGPQNVKITRIMNRLIEQELNTFELDSKSKNLIVQKTFCKIKKHVVVKIIVIQC